MKTAFTFALVLGTMSLTFVARAASVSIEPGVSYVRVSGVRAYAARENLSHNDTLDVTVPTLRVASCLDEAWSIGLQYTRYADLKGSGVSPTSDVFHDGSVAAQVITTVNSSERIQEISMDVRYHWKLPQNLALEVGPDVSWFHSRAVIWANYPSATLVAGSGGRTFRASGVNLGALAALRWTLSETWSVVGTYRYVAPKERSLNIFTASVAVSF